MTPARAGPFPATLPAGKTITGIYSMGSTAAAGGELSRGDISFVYPLASDPTGHYINTGSPSPAGCPGTPTAPAADPGHLCIYEQRATNVGARNLQSPPGSDGVTTVQGVALFATSAAAGTYVSAGRWAVTGN